MHKQEFDKQSVEIERAVPDDAETICDIRDRAWIEAYPNAELGITAEDIKLNAQGQNGEFVPKRVAYLKEQLAKDSGSGLTTFVAKADGKVVGYVDPRIDEQNHRRIGAIYVPPEAQGMGIGGKLMHKVLDLYGTDEDIFLEVVSYNQNAIDFYKRFGFEKTDAVVPDEEGRPDYMKSLPQIEMVLKAKTGEQIDTKEMQSKDVVELVQLLEQNDIEVYVDGGWGVDALLGEQTRKHGDLDIATPHKFVPKIRELFATKGYKEVPRDDTRDCNFVLGDGNGHEVDVHSYTFDDEGKNVYGVAYEPRHLTGTGSINGHPVKCIPADVMVEFHSGYELDADDYHDVKALCERYSIPLPEEYKKFTEQEQL